MDNVLRCVEQFLPPAEAASVAGWAGVAVAGEGRLQAPEKKAPNKQAAMNSGVRQTRFVIGPGRDSTPDPAEQRGGMV